MKKLNWIFEEDEPRARANSGNDTYVVWADSAGYHWELWSTGSSNMIDYGSASTQEGAMDQAQKNHDAFFSGEIPTPERWKNGPILEVTFSNEVTYGIPAHFVANDAALYYSERHGSSYKEEYDDIIEDEADLIDWAQGNMNWSNVKGISWIIDRSIPPASLEDEWTNAEMKVTYPQPTEEKEND